MIRPFHIDRAAGQRVSVKDLLFACLATFLVLPAIAVAVGAALRFLLPDTVRLPGDILMMLGFSALFAWIAVPLALGLGWLAARRGWIGWGTPVLAGAIGGLAIGLLTMLIDGAFYTTLFVPLILAMAVYGAGYGLLYWLSLRYLRPDLFKATP